MSQLDDVAVPVGQLVGQTGFEPVTLKVWSTSDGRRLLGPESRSFQDRPVAVADLHHNSHSVRYSLSRDLGARASPSGKRWSFRLPTRQAGCTGLNALHSFIISIAGDDLPTGAYRLEVDLEASSRRSGPSASGMRPAVTFCARKEGGMTYVAPWKHVT